MKNHKWKIYLILALLITFSCSNDDEGQNINDENWGLLKKIETDWMQKEIFYNENELVNKMENTTEKLSKVTYDIKYENNIVETITLIEDFFFSTYPNHITVYNITYENNQISITPTANSDRQIKITVQVTGRFVDSYRVYETTDQDQYIETIFTRNANDDIESISLYATDHNNTSVFNSEQTFLNFDYNLNLNPVFNPVFELSHSDFFILLNLKISNANPTGSTKLVSIPHFYEKYRSTAFDLTENGFITKCILQHLSQSYVYNFTYYERK